jgi:RecB family exonuclease
MPHLVTRAEWLGLLAAALPGTPRSLGAQEREVILDSSARAVRAAGFAPPFRLRPGLVAEMLALYDAIRRHGRGIDDLQRAADETVAPYREADGGAARLLEQAQFLVETFREYELRLSRSLCTDEHGARERLLAAPDSPFTHVIVAVGDGVLDAGGLWPSDFDLLTRIQGLSRLDVVATEASLAAGLLPRLRRWLPGLSEERDPADPGVPPVLVIPAGTEGRLHAQYRDREEEVAAIARTIKAGARSGLGEPLSRTGIVFRRPLPYVYVASRVLADASVPYDTFDALPLAAEPYAAAIDVVMACVESDFSREALLAVLRSPHFACGPGRTAVPHDAAAMLDRALSEARYLGGVEVLHHLAGDWAGARVSTVRRDSGLSAAAQAAADVARALAPVAEEARPAAQIARLLSFLDRFDVLPLGEDPQHERLLRARSAVRGVLQRLLNAHEAWGDDACPFFETAARVRRWIEEHTFEPRTGGGGVQVLDAQAARFADLDRVFIVGVVRPDWPDRRRRNIFFPASFLKHLGWPEDNDPRADARAAFEDLVRLAGSRVSVSSVLLDNDAIVEPSMLLDELNGLGLATSEANAEKAGPLMLGEALEEPMRPALAWPEPVRAWAEQRDARTPASDPRYHGLAGGQDARAYRVSAIDRYLDCPFTYFATDVLRLSEDPDDEEFLGPRARGRATHEALQRFFEEWQQAGRGAITLAQIDDARALFARVVETLIENASPTDAALLRASLLGSPVAAGVGDIVFQHEIDRPAVVVERLLEFTLDGDTELRCGDRTRTVVLKARADRIDLLADGTFRLVDYKLSRAPKSGRSVQLAAYAAAARARLAGHRGRTWTLGDATYVTFGRPPHVKPASRKASSLDEAMASGEARAVGAVELIEQGSFPPRPAEKHQCTRCAFAGVCRKDYVDEA